MFRNHLCITFELLSLNLYEFIKQNNFAGLSLGLIRRFGAQMLQTLKWVLGRLPAADCMWAVASECWFVKSVACTIAVACALAICRHALVLLCLLLCLQ